MESSYQTDVFQAATKGFWADATSRIFNLKSIQKKTSNGVVAHSR
jgi:hypothetical protein